MRTRLTLLTMLTWSTLQAQDRSFDLYRAHVAAAEAYLDLDQVSEAKEHLADAPEKHRSWEWRYLNTRADVSERTISAHGQAIWAVAAQSKGDLFATASSDSTIRLWSFPDGSPVATLRGHTGQVMALDFSPDGTRLASCATDKTIRIWDVSTRQVVQTIKEGIVQRVFGVRFSPDGSRILANSWEFNRQLGRVQGFTLLYDVGSGSLVRRYDITEHPESTSDFLPDGRSFVTGGWGFSLRRYSADSVHLSWGVDLTSKEDYTAIQWVDVSPDGARVAVAAKDDRIRLLDVTNGATTFVSEQGLGHRDDVNAISFSPDGAMLASAAGDGLVVLWNGSTGKRVRTLRGHVSGLNGVAWSANGKRLVSGGADGTIKIWSVDDRLEIKFDVCESGPWNAPVSPDGTFLVAACSDQGIGIWDLSNGTKLGLLPERSANAAVISRNGTHILPGGHDKMVRYWDRSSQTEARVFEGHRSSVFGVDLHAGGKIAASVSSDRTVRLWDLTGATDPAILDSMQAGMYSIAFSPDGGLLAAGSTTGEVGVWRMSDKKRIATWLFGEHALSLRFSPDGKILAASGVAGSVGLWDAKAMKLVRVLKGHTNSVYALAFTPDGDRIATASYDRTVRIWDMRSGLSVLTMRGSPTEYFKASFLENGKSLLLTTTNGGVRLLKVE